MEKDKNTSFESLETWLSSKPYWERFIWKTNLESEHLSEVDVETCYKYFSEDLGLEPQSGDRPELSFNYEIGINADTATSTKITIQEIKNLKDINALNENCVIKFDDNLTVIFGGNGAGKSGIGRLLANACFSRGERQILPNVKLISKSDAQPSATFVISENGKSNEIGYAYGESQEVLKRFSVFDAQSVLIHLDESNHIKFIPAQIKIFDLVADAVSKFEKRIELEKAGKKKEDPFEWMFAEESEISRICAGLNSATIVDDFILQISFDKEISESRIAEIEKRISDLTKLDVPKKRGELDAEMENLRALKNSIAVFVRPINLEWAGQANQLLRDIEEKKKLVEQLSVENFNDGITQTVGTAEWKALIQSAKILYDKEKLKAGVEEISYCPLCHQDLSDDAHSLFKKYWAFLESKAESELATLSQQYVTASRTISSTKYIIPNFLPTDAGIKTLSEQDPAYFAEIKDGCQKLSSIADEWMENIGKSSQLSLPELPEISLVGIDVLIAAKQQVKSKLVDPQDEITELKKELIILQHKKVASGVIDQAKDYLAYLKWLAKITTVNFAGIKMAVTKKRTEFFNIGVALNYKKAFNEELNTLGCEFDLIMHTTGEQGNTVKEYRLNFAEDCSPSQILSEGEQNACSIADFLTETKLDKNNCGVILDDPVTSLDHERKNVIAKRLVQEAADRQVIILTHDILFMSQLVKYANKLQIPFSPHWMTKIGGIPGHIEENTSPKLANFASLKKDCTDVMVNFSSLGSKLQERTLAAAFDYLRSACESMIEEFLFAGTIQRYDDHIKVQNLEQAIFDQSLALEIVSLHGEISEMGFMHNTSDLSRQDLPSEEDFNELFEKLSILETKLRQSRSSFIKERTSRKEEKDKAKVGW